MKVGIIGAGTMGSGIAQVAATAGCEVLLFDTAETALINSQQQLARIMNRLLEKGKISATETTRIQEHIRYITNIEELADCELIIEAIVENPGIKKEVFSTLAPLLRPAAILASNTSSLSIASLAASCPYPERFIGIHFFNPAPLMELVEIIPAIQTSSDTKERARAIIDSWGKLTVEAKDTPGFIVNRVARPFYGEALRIYEEGIADIATIDWALKTLGGFKMGPFELMDFIGNDVNYTVTETVFQAFFYDPRYQPAFTQKRMVEAGWLGRKSGKGYYDYTGNTPSPVPEEDQKLGLYILQRILAMLINEAAEALHYQIASKVDIDTAMTKGVNYPNGLLQWADEIGIPTCVHRLDALFDEYHESRYRCSPLLRKMAKNGTTFYPMKKGSIYV
ncbi:MAG: 3-hydroxyacyl-CoA dehydrogenase NAD-binding domain-containing protein [Saprospiraceae bacterium]